VLEEGHIVGLSLLGKAEGSEAQGLPMHGGVSFPLPAWAAACPGHGGPLAAPQDQSLPGPTRSDQLVLLGGSHGAARWW